MTAVSGALIASMLAAWGIPALCRIASALEKIAEKMP